MSSMLYDRENLANAKLTASLTTSATTVTVDDASVFSGLGDFYATIMPAGEMSRKSNSEIVKCTYASATTLAITRAQRGTTAKEFASGAIITNGIYTEDLEQVQYVGNGVFDTSYSLGVYTITTNNSMLPAIPTDGMKINVRINTDSSGVPGLDLQGTGAIYSIYSGSLVNNDLGTHGDSGGAALLAGETYELVFDAEVGGGCWKATGLVQLADVPFYDSLSTGSGQLDVPFYEQATGGGRTPIESGTGYLRVGGTLICWGTYYYDGAASWRSYTFPKTFASAPIVTANAVTSGAVESAAVVSARIGSVTTTGFRGGLTYVANDLPAAIGANSSLQWIAIGNAA